MQRHKSHWIETVYDADARAYYAEIANMDGYTIHTTEYTPTGAEATDAARTYIDRLAPATSISIVIEMDNAAFQPAPGAEVARILRELADKVEDKPLAGRDSGNLRDANGSPIGLWHTE